jgi:hypothetical protein
MRTQVEVKTHWHKFYNFTRTVPTSTYTEPVRAWNLPSGMIRVPDRSPTYFRFSPNNVKSIYKLPLLLCRYQIYMFLLTYESQQSLKELFNSLNTFAAVFRTGSRDSLFHCESLARESPIVIVLIRPEPEYYLCYQVRTWAWGCRTEEKGAEGNTWT